MKILKAPRLSVIKQIRKGIHRVNISAHICEHLVGERHTDTHRKLVGVLIAGVGVAIGEIESHVFIVKFICLGIGYALHGIGILPFVHTVENQAKLVGDKHKNGKSAPSHEEAHEVEYHENSSPESASEAE